MKFLIDNQIFRVCTSGDKAKPYSIIQNGVEVDKFSMKEQALHALHARNLFKPLRSVSV